MPSIQGSEEMIQGVTTLSGNRKCCAASLAAAPEAVIRRKALILHGLALCAVTLAITSMYASVISTPYGVIDDYINLWRGVSEDTSWLEGKYRTEGRLITGWLRILQYSWADSVSDLRLIRMAGLLGYLLAAWCIYFAAWRHVWCRVRSAELRALAAVASAMGVISLPAFQSIISTTESASYGVTIPLAMLASVMSERVIDASRSRVDRIGSAVAAVLALLAALNCFQPAAMWYWIFCGLRLADERVAVRRRLRGFTASIALGAAASLIGLVLIRMMALPNLDRSSLVTDLPGKITWFATDPLVSSLNFAFLTPSPVFAACMSVLIVVGTALYLRGSARERAVALVGLIVMIVLCYLPNLAVAESWAAYRTQVALTPGLYLLAMLALQGWTGTILRGGRHLTRRIRERDSRARPEHAVAAGAHEYSGPTRNAEVISVFAATLIGLLCATACATNTRLLIAEPQMKELAFLRSELHAKRNELERARALTIIPASVEDSTAWIRRFDEFGIPSTAHWWNRSPMVRIVLREMGLHARVRVDVGHRDASAAKGAPSSSQPTVDMRRFGESSP